MWPHPEKKRSGSPRVWPTLSPELHPNASGVGLFQRSARPALSKSDRIAIIGGGPAGVHMAALLCKCGYADVTILEAAKEVGGKSETLVDERGVVHDHVLHALALRASTRRPNTRSTSAAAGGDGL